MTIQYAHPTDLGRWCYGEFDEEPSYRVGGGHAADPLGFPVHVCRVCGQPVFLYARPAIPEGQS